MPCFEAQDSNCGFTVSESLGRELDSDGSSLALAVMYVDVVESSWGAVPIPQGSSHHQSVGAEWEVSDISESG